MPLLKIDENRAASIGPVELAFQIFGSCTLPLDPEREERRQDADEEHRAPAVARLDEAGDQHRERHSRSPSRSA